MRKRILLSAAASVFAFSLLWSVTGSSDPTSWTFTSIDVPGADFTVARDMNPAGQIVGTYEIPDPYAYRGFLLSNGAFTSIEVGEFNDTRGINPEGEIVGVFYVYIPAFESYAVHGYLLSRGTVTQIDYPGTDPDELPYTDYTVPEGINAAGDVVGFYGLDGTEHGFLLHNGVFITIDYPGVPVTNARGINSEGDIVGLFTNNADFSGPYHGFLRSKNGTFTTINGPGSPEGNANGINPLGQVVGEYSLPSVPGHRFGFLLSNGEYTTIMYPGAAITRAWKITPDGQHIVGFYDDQHGFVLSRKSLK